MTTGGAGLECKREPDSLKKCDTLHIWASTRRLLEGAEQIDMRKVHTSGAAMEFCLDSAQEFKNFGSDGEGFLTTAESQRIIQHALDAMKSHMEMSAPGYTEILLHKNRGIGNKEIE